MNKKYAMMGAISSRTGKLFVMYKSSYFEQANTIKFIKAIAQYHEGQKVCFFWDNSSVHVGREVSQYLREKSSQLVAVTNVPFEPELNGIETLWAQLKIDFRNRITELKIHGTRFDIREVLR